MSEHSVENIAIVQKRWEEVDVAHDLEAPYDVVIASFSLGMFDIRDAVEKMIQASSRYIYPYHFAGETSWSRQWKELWPRLHGRDYISGPMSDVLDNVLYQMGIYPNVLMENTGAWGAWSNETMEDAFAEIKGKLGLKESTEHDDFLRGLLKERLTYRDGRWVWPPSMRSALVYWDVERR